MDKTGAKPHLFLSRRNKRTTIKGKTWSSGTNLRLRVNLILFIVIVKLW